MERRAFVFKKKKKKKTLNLPLFLAFFFFSNLSYLFFSSFLTSEASSFPTFILYYDLSSEITKKRKKKERRESASPGSDLRGHGHGQRAWMDPRLCTATDLPGVCQVTKVDPNQTSTPFTEPTKESNSSSSSYFFFTLLLAYFKKNIKQINKQIKKTAAQF